MWTYYLFHIPPRALWCLLIFDIMGIWCRYCRFYGCNSYATYAVFFELHPLLRHCHITVSISSSPTYDLLLSWPLSYSSFPALFFLVYWLSYFFFHLLIPFGSAHALRIFYFHSYLLGYMLYFWDHGVLVVFLCLFC